MKKILLIYIVFMSCTGGGICQAEKMKQLVLTGPPVAETYPLYCMQEFEQLNNIADEIKFVPWDSTDQLRAMIVAGQVDYAILTTASAAKFYNKGVPIRIVDVLYPSSLGVVSADPDIESIRDLKGTEVVLPFRPGDMPEVIFSVLMSGQGLVQGSDIRLRYVGSPMMAVQLMLLGRAKNAFLSEPAISMAVYRSRLIEGKSPAPLLRKSIDIQHEWSEVYPEHPFIPLVAIAAVGNKAAMPEVVRPFRKAYRANASWCLKHPVETAKQFSVLFPGLCEKAVSENIKATCYRIEPAAEARGEINFFLNIVKAKNPACIGGKIPDENVIWKP
ncbi:NitT/TauT family transport system substrate-binding protein [Desulfosalsimonas propionicica]|uniref:NitT/TauT family transport system substrate-binding protein n=1 Tax=Desulfosalsimonas propionicica TaxID=332175 RepID=A0A7W0CCK9_9BACT|nr:ABC transporter substrate-binding protein [Desulfosalsimonas propionicica]MBA2883271.1 NitT/TauT family transport system substrate-binding protein [Desulfosalsimonas propionicica]